MGRQLLLLMIVIIMGGCSNVITEDQLIGDRWVPKSGYKDGEATGEPLCPPFDKGIEFKDEETVYVESGNKDFRYHLRESDDGMEISFYNPNGEIDFLKVFIENDDNLVLLGAGISENHNCYFEREK